MTRTKRLAAAAAATVLAVGAVGIAVTIAPANADQAQQSIAELPSAAPASVAPASVTQARPTQGVARGSTMVAYSQGALAALAPLNPSAIRPGTFTLGADEVSVQSVYPIVGNTKKGIISHVGGLTLTDGPNTVTLLNYQINTTKRVLTATAFQNGKPLGKVAFLTLTPAPAQTGCDANVGLLLAPATAFVLSDAFGAADLSGANIGSACVNLR
jgi:hypothetical protein